MLTYLAFIKFWYHWHRIIWYQIPSQSFEPSLSSPLYSFIPIIHIHIQDNQNKKFFSCTKPNRHINAQTKWNQCRIPKKKKTKKYELYFPDYKLYTNKITLLGPFWDKPQIIKYPQICKWLYPKPQLSNPNRKLPNTP